jgi:hypothetical protein
MALAGGPAPAQSPEAARNGWLPTLEEGKVQARATGKPLMVVLRCDP